jgi:transcriptional regulator with XRE-family HTH domain
MPGIDGKFVRDFRIGHAWSQEQLAGLSGVSARTIARLERSCTASLETIKALSAALGVPLSSLMTGNAMDSLVKRITPMTVLADIAPSLRDYRALGFSIIETGDPGCVGLKAGASAPILAALEFMAGDFEVSSVAPLEGRTIPYIWVKSIAAAKSLFPDQATVVEQAVTRVGMLEALVKQGSQYSIFAEKCGARSG